MFEVRCVEESGAGRACRQMGRRLTRSMADYQTQSIKKLVTRPLGPGAGPGPGRPPGPGGSGYGTSTQI
ncbi:hypothetical protein E2C01_019564 [Portunus trituberculatus]|uniref:Uncharacterized protein n=1 Tax=Portunus trituberculatus TaxID=210409 RepID=A0A5B7DYM5_PORTR|nr:hypothetical protein [Portunus trituberculatus]